MSWITNFLRNLTRGDMPLARRLVLIAANYRSRFVSRQACCGHPGEPGC